MSRANDRPWVKSSTDSLAGRSFHTQKKGMDSNYQRNIDLKKINHPDLDGKRDKMKEIGEQVIVPRLSLPRDLTMTTTTLEKGRRMRKRMEKMIILLLIGIPRMIPRIHRIGTFPPSFLILSSLAVTAVADNKVPNEEIMDYILYHVNHYISLHGFLNRFTGHYRILFSIRRWVRYRHPYSIIVCGRLRSWSAILIANLGDSTDRKEYSLYRHPSSILYPTSPHSSSQQLYRSCKFPLPPYSTSMLIFSVSSDS